jgi:hypothetical protein
MASICRFVCCCIDRAYVPLSVGGAGDNGIETEDDSPVAGIARVSVREMTV